MRAGQREVTGGPESGSAMLMITGASRLQQLIQFLSGEGEGKHASGCTK